MKPLVKKTDNPKTISDVYVKSLFGKYTYNIEVSPTEKGGEASLLILYGDNGSGKTTLLKLMRALLLPGGGGRKTFIANTPFRELIVKFTDGTIISAERKEGLLGSFTQHVVINQKSHKLVYEATKSGNEYTIKADSDESLYDRYDVFIKRLGISLHYLSDTRQVQSDGPDKEEDNLIGPMRAYAGIYRKQHKSHLDVVSQNALEWARKQLIQSSKRGDTSTNEIYRTLIQKLATTNHQSDLSKKDIPELLSRLRELDGQNKDFADLELTSRIDTAPIQEILKKRLTKGRHSAYQVASVYADGIEAKLNALKQFKDLLQTFLSNVNSFFVDKRLCFNLRDGFSIRTGANQVLELDKLSSGERQLLLLMLDTLASGDNSNIIIIDEPEISLNIKWQRSLIKTLLACFSRPGSQLILATHSMQILSNYQKHTRKLESRAR